MFGVRSAMKRYLTLIAPWCTTQWSRESFASDEARAARLDPTHAIFLIPERPYPGLFEQWLLGESRADALVMLISWVRRFNEAAARFNATPASKPDLRIERCIVAHGVIGTSRTGCLWQAFVDADAVV